MVCDYLFWYTAFTIPSALSATLQGFGQSYGDKNADDLRYFKRWGMIVSFLRSAVVYAAMILLDRSVCQVFGADAAATFVSAMAITKRSERNGVKFDKY